MKIVAYIVILLIIGFFARGVVPLALGFAGAPGAILAGEKYEFDTKKKIGLVLTILGQTTVILFYEIMLIGYIRSAMFQQSIFWAIVFYILGFVVALSPVQAALHDSVDTEKENPDLVKTNTQHLAISFMVYVAVIIYLVFAIFPSLSSDYFSWLPFVT